jgi:tetratricopeptide (TPR) repeat protein/predicted Ser/Thr protein kinase
MDTTPTQEAAPPALSSTLPHLPGYDILEVLGRGGMGCVYKARHRGLERIVALKMLHPGIDNQLVTRFEAEARAVAGVQHPNIAQVFEAGRIDGQPYYALEFVEGGSLAQRLAGKPLPPDEAAALVEQVARAIQVCHEKGVLHRDLKPANILLARDGTPRVVDFGLAKRLGSGAGLTQTGEILGTPSYMAPEQASGVVRQLGPAVDVYALGAVLYELLTGRPPFQGIDALQILALVVSMDPIQPRRLQPGVPRDLETICLKCLEKAPKRRYASARDLADDLRSFRDGRPIRARPVRAWERAVKWARRRPAAAALVIVAALLIFVTLVAGIGFAVGYVRLQKAVAESEESLQVARVAVDRLLVRLSDNLAPVPQAEQARRESLEDAQHLYERLCAMRPRDAGSWTLLAESLARLGEIERMLGRPDEAERAIGRALDVYARIRREDPDNAEHRLNVAKLHNNLGLLRIDQGDWSGAETEIRQALDEADAVKEAPGDVPEFLRRVGKFRNNLALVLRQQKRTDEAERYHRDALAMREALLRSAPDDHEARVDVAVSHVNLGAVRAGRGDKNGAAAEFAAAAAVLTEGGATSTVSDRFLLAQVQSNRAAVLDWKTRAPEVEQSLRAALATLEALSHDFPAVLLYRHRLAGVRRNLGQFLAVRGNPNEAHNQLVAARDLLQAITKADPSNAEFQKDLRECGDLLTDLAFTESRLPTITATPAKP